MSIATTFILRCDRCGTEQSVADGQARPDGWGGVAARLNGGGPRIGKDGMDDLCPSYITDFLSVWFIQAPANAATTVASPVPPRPVVTIEDRREAIRATIDILKINLEDLRQHLRDDPTSILADQLPAALTDQLAFRAQAIVAGIVRRLKLEEQT